MDMIREAVHVKPLNDYRLLVTFDTGENRIKDMKPYLNKGVFKALQDPGFFSTVRVNRGAVEWPGEIDMCPDALYETSTPVIKN